MFAEYVLVTFTQGRSPSHPNKIMPIVLKTPISEIM